LVRALEESESAVRLYVAGDRTHVGKTTTCLGVLAYLRGKLGLRAEELAYIKPATQCEAPDLLARYCEAQGIACVAGSEAPIVYYSGFTRAVISGEVPKPDLAKVAARIDELCRGKKFCLVDGVGFPGVGSCCGCSNADLASCAGAPVLLVAQAGVGAAIDAHAQNACFFEAKNVPVLGGVFNLAPLDGFYAKDKVEPVLSAAFAAQFPRHACYGVVPVLPDLDGERAQQSHDPDIVATLDHFARHVDLPGLLLDAALDVANRRRRRGDDAAAGAPPTTTVAAAADDLAPSRGAIEQRARAAGAVVSS